jgi:ATP-dependent DNA helicase PIF1
VPIELSRMAELMYPPKYLNTIEVANLPHHEFKVKVAALVILLRNLNPSAGLCNGTRMRVLRCGQRVIDAEILSSRHAGSKVFIPWIPLSPAATADLPFEFIRVQFPLGLAFAMTINKSQDQTLNFVGGNKGTRVRTWSALCCSFTRHK